MKKQRSRTKAQLEADKRRTGRPKKKPAEKYSAKICVAMTEDERALLEAEAAKRGVSISDLVMLPWRASGKEQV